MRRATVLIALCLARTAVADSAKNEEAADEAALAYEPWTITPGGFLQPAYRTREDADGAPDDTNGFRLVRARATATGHGKLGNLELGAYFEAELQPQFSLFDAYATISRSVPKHGRVSLDLGQTRVPISRQQLLSDTRLSFAEKGQIASIAPDRDLGARLQLMIPHAKLWLGAFNGEGRDIGANADQSFFYAVRAEVTLLGDEQPLQESAFSGKWAGAAMSYGHNPISNAAFAEVLTYTGLDVSGAYEGVSGSFEYLEVVHDFRGNEASFPLGDAQGNKVSSYKANGFVAQLAYLLPFKLPPLHGARAEVAFRVEEIDRNDTVPIIKIADPNQAQRVLTFAASYYLRKHTMKIQLSLSHFKELDDIIPATNASASYANDQALLQLTYRVE